MSTFANSVKRTCAAVCPLYGDVPMGAPGPPGQKGPPGPPVSLPFLHSIKLKKKRKGKKTQQQPLDVVCFRHHKVKMHVFEPH